MSKDSQTPLGVTYGSLGVLGPSAVAEVAQAAVAAGYRPRRHCDAKRGGAKIAQGWSDETP